VAKAPFPYDLRGYLITYITWDNLLHSGVIILIKFHITRYVNMPGGLVLVSIGMGFVCIINKHNIKGFRTNLPILSFLFLIKRLHSKTRNYNVWLIPHDKS
jgi:hypothetical protein